MNASHPTTSSPYCSWALSHLILHVSAVYPLSHTSIFLYFPSIYSPPMALHSPLSLVYPLRPLAVSFGNSKFRIHEPAEVKEVSSDESLLSSHTISCSCFEHFSKLSLKIKPLALLHLRAEPVPYHRVFRNIRYHCIGSTPPCKLRHIYSLSVQACTGRGACI